MVLNNRNQSAFICMMYSNTAVPSSDYVMQQIRGASIRRAIVTNKMTNKQLPARQKAHNIYHTQPSKLIPLNYFATTAKSVITNRLSEICCGDLDI